MVLGFLQYGCQSGLQVDEELIVNAITWSPAMAVGITEVDQAHRDFFIDIEKISQMPNESLQDGLLQLTAKLERDFRREEDLMEACHSEELKLHREQHAKLLKALHYLMPDIMQGNYLAGRQAIDVLPNWFFMHVSTADQSMAKSVHDSTLCDKQQRNKSLGLFY